MVIISYRELKVGTRVVIDLTDDVGHCHENVPILVLREASAEEYYKDYYECDNPKKPPLAIESSDRFYDISMD